MATSGSTTVKVTNWDDLVFSWSVSSQSVSGNYSIVNWTLKLVAGSSGRISSTSSKVYSVKVNGVTYGGTNTIGISNNSTKTLASGSSQINHDANGSKTFSYSFSQIFNISFSGSAIHTISGSGTGTLPTISRASTLSVSAGTLGTAQTITINRNESTYRHRITYTCGSSSGNILGSATEYSTATSTTWTPPIALASQNTVGTTVNVTLKLQTFTSTGANVGTTEKMVTYTIPASVKPSCSISVTDAEGYIDTVGYIKGYSRFKVVVTATPSYGSGIASYSTTANGSTYTTASFTTEVLKSSGSLTITATVKDKRGRTGTATQTITVFDYTPCTIEKMTAVRCNQDGTDNPEGEHIKITVSAFVTKLVAYLDNYTTWKLSYKRAADSAYTDIWLDDDHGDIFNETVREVTDATVVLPVADGDNSYDVKFYFKDGISSASRTVTVSTAFALMEFNIDKKAIAFGKRLEQENLMDVGLQTRFTGGLLSPILEPDTDLNELRTPNTYTGANVSSYNYANCPVASGTFTLVVESGGESGQVIQTYKTVSKHKPEIYTRHYYQGEWGNWFWSSPNEALLYENSSGSAGAITLTFSAVNYRYLEIYFTDNNGKLGGYTKVWNPNGKAVNLHIQEAGATIFSRQTLYTISGTSMTPDTTNASYFKITSAGSVSVSMGTNYIKIVRVIGRA